MLFSFCVHLFSFLPKINFLGLNNHVILHPYCALNSSQFQKQIMNREIIAKVCQKYGFQTLFATLRLNFRRTEISTAKPMVVGCVQHYTTHFIKKLGKQLETFFSSPKNCQKGPKRAKMGQKGGFQQNQQIVIKKWQRHIRAPMVAQLHSKFQKNPQSSF